MQKPCYYTTKHFLPVLLTHIPMSPAATPHPKKNKTSLPLQANTDLIKIPLFLFNRRHSIDKKYSVYLWLIIVKDKFNQSFLEHTFER